MNERSSLPDVLTSESAGLDPELLALPAPPRAMRAIAVSLLAITAVFAAVLAAGLMSDVGYTFTTDVPRDVGDLAALVPDGAHGNTFVTAAAKLDGGRALRYGRTTEADSFELAPVVSNPQLWVEMRVPQGIDRPAPPAVFVGRLVPMPSAAFRYRGLGRSHDLGATPMPDGAWVLIDGATPRSYRWTVALTALLVLFVAYSLATIARIVRRIPR